MPRLLATDLDGTLIGDDDAMHRLWSALRATDIVIAFSTGRHLQSIQQFYRESGLDGRADACICMVGTDIYVRDGDAYTLDEAWHENIAAGWDRDTVEQLVAQYPGITPQDDQWQSRFKASYFVEADDGAEQVAQLRTALKQAGIDAKVVYSADRYLDLLPARSGKGEAVRFLAEQLEVAPDDVITAGDTGNDLDMMRPELGFRGIVVGNAAEELKQQRGPHVYHADAHCAAGIREGLLHYGWL